MPTLALNRELRMQWKEKLTAARTLRDRGANTPEERTKLRSLVADARQLRQRIEDVESSMIGPIRGDQPDGGGSRDAGQDEYKGAFLSYLRYGRDAMPQEARSILDARRAPAVEQRDMITGGTGAGGAGVTSGGFFVPIGFVDAIISTLKTTGPMLDPAVITLMETDSGQILPYPASNDVSVTGERVGEGQQVTEADTLLGQVLFGAYQYSSKLVKVSNVLLEDSAFDLETFLVEQFALRLGRTLNSDFTLGTGSANSQPQGVVTATLANGTLVLAVGSSSNDGTAAGTNSIGTDDLTSLIHGIDPLYRPGASFMMNDSTHKALLKTKDKYGRPILDPNVQNPAANTYLGYPIRVNNYMDTLQLNTSSPAVTRNSVLYGPLRRYMTRRVRSLSVLRLVERWADYNQTGFLAFARYDGNVLAGPNASGQQYPFALLQNIY